MAAARLAGRGVVPLLLAVLFGLAIGLSVGALGGGGSVLAVPVLIYVLDQSVSEATTTSLAVVAGGAVAGAASHAASGRVCWRHAVSFTAAALPAVAIGTVAGEAVGGAVVIVAFAALMLVAARATWQRAEAAGDDDGWQPGGGACPPLRVPRDLLAGGGVGLLTGFLGVGGGFLVVPILAVALAFTMRTAVGTSLAIITATSLAGLVAHLVAGRSFDVGVGVPMALACVAGAIGGAAIAERLPQPAIGRGFAVLLTAVAVYLVVSTAVLGGPPGT